MSVKQISNLKIATPSKRYVNYEINGWMETVYKVPRGKENIFLEVQLPAVPSKSAQLQVKNRNKREPNYLRSLKRNKTNEKEVKQPISKTLQVKKVLKQKHLNSLPGFEEKPETCQNSWHCKPLIKHSFKLKQKHFQSHLINQSFDLVELRQPENSCEVKRNKIANLFL